MTDSARFVSTISNKTILDNEIMVFFDVESLFTNAAIDAAVPAALQKLDDDPIPADRMTVTPTQIADLLNFVLRSTYGSIYGQIEGAAIGSPVSTVSSLLTYAWRLSNNR